MSQNIKNIKGDQGTLSVSRTVIGDTTLKPKQRVKKITVRPFVTNPAHVSVKLGATIPTADYASVRLDVMFTVPCYVEEMVDIYKETRAKVEELLDAEIDEIQSDLGEGGD